MQGRILAKWPMTAAAKCFPMALDEANHRIFAGCRQPAKLLVLDMETGKAIAQLDCPGIPTISFTMRPASGFTLPAAKAFWRFSRRRARMNINR